VPADDIDDLLAQLASGAALGPQPAAVADFADQFGVDVSAITDEQRTALSAALGKATYPVVVRIYLADFLPRVGAGLAALGLPVPWGALGSDGDPVGVLFDQFLPAVARLHALDPVTTELVRLFGARAHDCRLCKSLRDGDALDTGGSESLYDDIDRYEFSERLTDAHKAALRYADALIWTPSDIDAGIAAQVLRHFDAGQARELTLDVMRNASNKIAVALKADAPHVGEGTERYLIGADGHPVYTER
jgi:hypothetical protein